MSKVDAHIILYADDYSYDVWEDYCNICGVSSSANSICIGFDYVNVEETVQCSCCGANIKESKAELKTFEDGEDYICSVCLEDFGRCESCGIYFPREELYAHAGGTVCADCYDEAELWR